MITITPFELLLLGCGMLLGWWLARVFGRASNPAHTEQLIRRTEQSLADTNRERIEEMLRPFYEQIDNLKRDVRDSSRSQIDLKGQLQQMSSSYQLVSQQAENLTKALKGESQTRGKWGEMLLEKVLEGSGLREGEEYTMQKSFTDRETGGRYRPDAVISLPANREVIVDAKTSLVDYERYATSQQQDALNKFLHSLRSRVKELADKDYANVQTSVQASVQFSQQTSQQAAAGAKKTFDYVLMFVPIESAFSLALDKDKGLMDYALERKIVLVSPSTLLLALRTIYYSWRTERQNKHAEEIAREGGLLYDKVASFIEDMEKHGQQLTTAQKSYDGAMKKLSSGRGSIVSRTQKLEELGVKSSKRLKYSASDEEE